MTDVFLNPGQYFAGDHHHRVHTLLGSCVSVVLWHRARRVGAMSHYLLAERPAGAGRLADPRYGVDAMLLMRRALAARRVDWQECEGHVYGGADMAAAGGGIGRRNGELALALLREGGVAVRASALYGRGSRRLTFDIASGVVRVADGVAA